MALSVSPDRSQAVIDLQGSLWIVPMHGGVATRITNVMVEARQPTWSPDGARITFQGFGNDGTWQIYTVRPDGSEVTALTSGRAGQQELLWVHQEPHWSPDGRQIAFSSERAGKGNHDIWILDVATGQLRQLTTEPGNEFYPAWSPDGREVAYVATHREQPGVYAISLTGTERLIAPSSTEEEVGGPSWSPDGKVLFSVIEGTPSTPSTEPTPYTAQKSRLVYDGKTIATGEDYFPFRAHWISADKFVYPADGKIRRRSLAQGVRPPVAFTATLTVTRPSYTRKRREFDAGPPKRALGIIRPVMAPDGQRLAFAAVGDLWLAPLGQRPQRLTDDVFVDTDPAWSPDGTQIAFASDRAGNMDIWVHDLQTGRDRRLTSLPEPEMAPAWSPDGTKIAFIGGGLFVVPAEGGEPKNVGRGGGYPSWAPDGRFLIVTGSKPYTSRRREAVVYYSIVPADGGPATLVVPEAHQFIGRRHDGAALSPDGKHLAFIRHAYLYVLPVGPDGRPTGPARQLTTELADSVSWAGPDQILYRATDRLKLLSLADGRTRDVPLDLTWTRKIPDGRLVVHAGRLIDGVQASARTGMDVVIEKNRIVAIEPHRAALHTGRVIDATGQSVMPGLIEGHAHMSADWGTRFGRIHLAYGITSVRVPGLGNPYELIEGREAVEAGRRPGPLVFTAGYGLDGVRSTTSTTIPNEAVMDLELERARRLDFDLLKTYHHLPVPLQKRAIERAHRVGIPVTSHEIYPVAAFGTDSVEHFRSHDRRSPTSAKHSPLDHAYEDVIQIVAKSGMTMTPTSAKRSFRPAVVENPALVTDPRMQRLQRPSVLEWLRELLPGGEPRRGSSFNRTSLNPPNRNRPERETIRKLHDAGATLIAGIDAPVAPYGAGLHIELQDYVAVGLTPFEALRTATVNTATLVGAASELGTLETGKLADLVVVDGNPLVNINDAMNVRVVIKNGEVFTIEQLLDFQAPGATSSR